MRSTTTEATAQQLRRRRAAIASSSSLLVVLAVVLVLFASTANAACPFAGKSGERYWLSKLRVLWFFSPRRERSMGGTRNWLGDQISTNEVLDDDAVVPTTTSASPQQPKQNSLSLSLCSLSFRAAGRRSRSSSLETAAATAGRAEPPRSHRARPPRVGPLCLARALPGRRGNGLLLLRRSRGRGGRRGALLPRRGSGGAQVLLLLLLW